MRISFILTAFLLLWINTRSEEVKWNAQWIMHPTAQPNDHAVVFFRKNFELKQKPDSFRVHVSADNHYRLFVNGHYVTRGPARGDLAHWFYETLDLAPYLVVGTNVIAAEVVNWGPKRSFAFFSQMTSFIMQGATPDEQVINTSGGSWLCHHSGAHKPIIVDWIFDRTSIDFGLYVGNPTDSIIGAQYPWGWELPGFDDSKWLPAKWADNAGGRNTQYAGGILFSGGKLLIPRTVPLLQEKKVPFSAIRRSEGITVDNGFLQGKKPLTIPGNRKVTLLIDHERLTMGYPEMRVSGGKGAKIRARYAENLIVKNKSPKGNRNDIEGKYMVGIRDVFIPDGGSNRVFKPTCIRTFRFIQLDMETGSEPLTIDEYYHIECRAPLTLKAEFETGNPLTDWMMEAGWRSVSLCAQDMLLSDAYYEQMQYTGDSRVHNLTLMTLSGDDRLTRNALVQFDQSRIPEGLTYACYPNPFHLIIPSYSLMWIDQVHDYMMWKDDTAFIAQFDLGIYSVIDWFEKRRQTNGLLGPIEWWGAFAWPRHYRNGQSPTIYEGNNTLYTLQYAYSLRHAAEIYEFTGKTSQADIFRKRADEICNAVNRLCKNRDGFYTESPDNEQISQITNLLAILAGAVSGNEARTLMLKLLEPKDWFGQVDLFLHNYLFEAMGKTGLQDYFEADLSEWQLMKERGLTTFVEVPLEWGEENQRSECHPWSSAPNYHFFRTVCGIKPISPGHRKVEISPSFGNFNYIKATYPHHLGNITINLKKAGEKIQGEVWVPEAINAHFIWAGKKIELQTGNNRIEL